MHKNPVEIDAEVDIDGSTIDAASCQFWSDTFRREDILHYQSGTVQMMLQNDETTTYELLIESSSYPEIVSRSLDTGDRFPITVECPYFDLDVDNAHVVDKDGDLVTVVAEVPWTPL